MKFVVPILLAAATWLRAQAPSLPAGVVNTQRPEDRPLPPAEALARMTPPPGFRVTLFAGEPDLRQPIAFDFDDRGRVWVIENFSYPDFQREDQDRVVIFADRDGDGRFDERKVFLERGHRLSGLALGFGGVWLASTPNLLFVPDTDGDDRPDGPPEVRLDGWTTNAQHNLMNGLAWGSDGWLYGRHGITTWSFVGRPGAPDRERVKLSCSIWRYHPVTRRFEVVVNGTTNPWGLDWDEHGQAFFSNNVLVHLWHLIPGAHFRRMFGEDFDPHVYALMETCADHKHFAGNDWTKSRGGQGEHDLLGGGHSHSGAMIYQGDNWPDEWRDAIFMGNIHGNRLVFDRLERRGSGYVARHGGDFMKAHDPWFRPITVACGPDGGVFVSDWNDYGECHDADGSFRDSGRLYKITWGQPKPTVEFDLAKQSDAELVKLLAHRNDWWARHARRLLQERAVAGRLDGPTESALRRMLADDPSVPHQLRALWALHSIGRADEALLVKLLGNPSEHLRWWAVTLLVEDRGVSPAVLHRFAQMAKNDPSAFVRLALASALQRLPPSSRWEVAAALAAHAEDAVDPNLPLMLWYGIEPAVASDPARATQFLPRCAFPQVRQFIARRLAEE